jgi:Outer membrane protein beta-barrel domain
MQVTMRQIPLLISALSFLLVATTVNAQIKFGPLIGLNFAKLSSPSSSEEILFKDVKSIVGLKIGGILQYAPSPKYSIQTGFLYSGMGADYRLYNKFYGYKSQLIMTRLNYISIPLEFHYNIIDTTSCLSGYTGLDINILLLGTTNGGGRDDAYKKLDPSWKFGFQYLLPVGLGFRLDYNLGLSGVINTVDIYGDDYNLVTKNRSFGITTFWLFGNSGVI